MWIQMTPTFRQQAREHKLAFCCEDCLHFCDQQARCAILYPTEPHRAAQVEALQDGDRLYFCKMFEPA